MSFAFSMIIALAIDGLIGWPAPLFAKIGHPVTWLGALISFLETRWNKATHSNTQRFFLGAFAALIAIAASAVIPIMISGLIQLEWLKILIFGILAWPLVAMRSMHDHVRDVAMPLMQNDLPAARQAVSMIVGRDPAQLDENGIARAALESLAENSSDGIVAPVFWGALFGFTGIAAYKAINTLDSMIGHRNARYEYFGKFAARLDDVVNYLPSRLTGILFALASGHFGKSVSVIAKDARFHRSPNAGWPEAALAGGLDIRLSGPRIYGDRIAREPWVNNGAKDPDAGDIDRGLALYRRMMVALALLLGIVALI